jgi:hypothetical protein
MSALCHKETSRPLPRAPTIGVVFDRELPKGRAEIPIIIAKSRPYQVRRAPLDIAFRRGSS